MQGKAVVELLSLLSVEPGGWGRALAQGLSVTLSLALATLPFGLAAGLGLALAINGRRRWLARGATVFATTFRALPELLTLFIIYYGAQMLISAAMARLGVPGQFELSAFVAGMIALGIVFASFASEIFVAAIRAVPLGQHEAAAALGLSGRAAFRDVVWPQVFRFALPGLGNLWFVLLKDTSLVSIIALSDLMRQTNLAVANTKEPLFFYAVTCAIYLVISLISGGFVSMLERRAARGTVGAR